MRVLVCGGAGFIGRHLVRRLVSDGHAVDVADLDGAQPVDLRDARYVNIIFGQKDYDEVYQLAAQMGGMGYIGNPANDARIVRDNTLINLNVLEAAKNSKVGKLFFASSACVYPDIAGPLREDQAYPANPDSEYGWEKLYAERLYAVYARNFGLNVRIGRFHNVYGHNCTWRGGREKAPAAICRKVAEAKDGGEVELWGDGNQSRSFLYVDECLDGVRRLMDSAYTSPINIGSSRLIAIHELFLMVCRISGKHLSPRYKSGPVGVKTRNSDNTLIRQVLDWAPTDSLEEGMKTTYEWIREQVELEKK